MLKYVKAMLMLSFSVLLVACGQQQDAAKTSGSEEAGKVELIVDLDTNVVDENVTFEKGDTVMDVLEDNYKVEETDGFITAIDGLEQDTAKGVYWFFKVNDDMAPKAADQIEVKAGDKIEFYQEKAQ